MTYYKIIRKLKHILGKYLIQNPRILKYKLLSNCKYLKGNPIINQPTQFLGNGIISFGDNVKLGFNPSPMFYNSYGFIEARNEHSTINFGNNININNSCIIISEGEGIEIGENTLIGFNVEITDSDFHDLDSKKRRSGIPKTEKVFIGKNVFIGSNVKILKGVFIGDNSVIANSSIVTKSIPENVIAGGYPCKVLKNLEFN